MNWPLERPVLTTARLRLRPFELTDSPEVQRLAGAPEVAATTLNIPHPYPNGAAEAWIDTHGALWLAHEQLQLAVTLRDTGALVGSIGLVFSELHEKAELGYWIGVPYWNRGYATEAARALVHCSFTDFALHRLQAHHMGHNPASARVLQKIGLHREGTSPQALKKNGRFVDLVLYGVLRAGWSGLA
jgi:RimJ/RimL family protein N-acetyltransferase